MPLNTNQISELYGVAKNAAIAAGEFLASKQGTQIEVFSKDAGESIASRVVTEIDIEAQNIILQYLKPTLLPYQLGLLTEESIKDDKSRFERNYFWCVDPLDGTLCFSQNKDGYSVSIALVSKTGTPIIGVVYNPRHKILYHAVTGEGAFKNNTPFKIKENSSNLTLLFDQSYLDHPLYEQQIKQLKKDLKKVALNKLHIYPLGGAVMNAISTIEMAPAIYFKFPKKANGGGSLWDFAASSVIQSEAGGHNSDYFNNPIDLNRIDSTFMNHKGIIYVSSKELLDIIPVIAT